MNDVTYLGGGGISQKVMLLRKAYLVKWVTRGKKFQKMVDLIYGQPFLEVI